VFAFAYSIQDSKVNCDHQEIGEQFDVSVKIWQGRERSKSVFCLRQMKGNWGDRHREPRLCVLLVPVVVFRFGKSQGIWNDSFSVLLALSTQRRGVRMMSQIDVMLTTQDKHVLNPCEPLIIVAS
jgi:hypothetical protein